MMNKRMNLNQFADVELTKNEMAEIKGGKVEIKNKDFSSKKILPDNYKKRVLNLGIFQIILSKFRSKLTL